MKVEALLGIYILLLVHPPRTHELRITYVRFTLTSLPFLHGSGSVPPTAFPPLALICTLLVVFNIVVRRWCHLLTIIAVGAAYIGLQPAIFPLAGI